MPLHAQHWEPCTKKSSQFLLVYQWCTVHLSNRNAHYHKSLSQNCVQMHENSMDYPQTWLLQHVNRRRPWSKWRDNISPCVSPQQELHARQEDPRDEPRTKGNVTESSLCACDMSWAGSRGTKGGVVGFKGLCWTVSWMDNSSGSEQVDPCDHKSKRTSLALEMANLVDISKISVSRPSSNMYKL